MRTLIIAAFVALLCSADYPANAPEVMEEPEYLIVPVELPIRAEQGVEV